MWKYVAGVLLAVCLAFAQDTRTATLVGTVTDSTGAVVPRAKVTVTNAETGFVSTGQTNPEGAYYIPYLAPGAYRLVVEAGGFKKYERAGFEARAAETPRIDVALEVGNIAESVQVTGAAPLLETETAVVGAVQGAKAIIELPLLQLKAMRVLYYMPGVTPGGGVQNALGQSESQMGYFLDGVSGKETMTSVVGDTNSSTQPTMDAVEEVKLWTTGAPAEIGHVAGAALSFVFKSGANQVHGALEDRYLNKAMVHRQYLEQPARTNPINYHEMQGTISGPVYIPKIYNGKNRTFFLFGVGRHQEKDLDGVTTTVPSLGMLAGNFNFPGVTALPLYDPATIRASGTTYTSDPLPGNIIPLNRFDPAVTKFLSYNPWRAPNAAGYYTTTGPASNLVDFDYVHSYRTRYDAKVDQQISANHKISGRYSQDRHRVTGRNNIVFAWPQIDPSVPGPGMTQPVDQRNVVFSDYYTFSPTTMNEMRLGYNRRHQTNTPATANQGWAAKLGIPNAGSDNFPNFGQYGMGSLTSSSSCSEDFTFQDNVTKVVGRNTFKAGYELIRTRQDQVSGGNTAGSYSFGGTAKPFTPNTGIGFASFLMGGVTSASFGYPLVSFLPRWWEHSLYAQDDWRPRKGLTISVGLRWTYQSPAQTKYGFKSAFNPNVVDALTGLMGAITHPKGTLYNADWKYFQPRFGLAWNFAPKFVFRGSFGIITSDQLAAGGTEEYSTSAQINQPTGDPRVLFYLSQGPPKIQYKFNPDGTSPILATGSYSGRGTSYFDPNYHATQNMNWSGGVQWEFRPTWLAEVVYQGQAAIHMASSVNINQLPWSIYSSTDQTYLYQVYQATQNYVPYFQFGSITYNNNAGHMSYHSQTTRVEKRYSAAGITLNTFWTWQKTLTGSTASGYEYYNWRLTKQRTGYDLTHRIVEELIVDLPFGKGRKFMTGGGIKDYVLGGWRLFVIQTWESGPPLTFGISGSPNRYLSGESRPVQILPNDQVRTANWVLGPNRLPTNLQNPLFNINAFAYPAAYTMGSIGYTTAIGNWLYWPQFSLSKQWSFFKERTRFSVRLDSNGLPTRLRATGPGTTIDFTNPTTCFKFAAPTGANYSQIGTENGNLVLMFRLEF